MGTSTIVYVSIPSASLTCAGMGLPTLPAGYTYRCTTSQNFRNTDGTGWIPVNFQRISSNAPISQLPIDPQNTTSTKYYSYVTGGSWKLMATPESQKYLATAAGDGGVGVGQFEAGNDLSLASFTDGLIGWWKFDDTDNTTTTDSSGWGKNGTWYGTSTLRYVAGKVGVSAGTFNGSSDTVGYHDYNTDGANLAVSYSFWNLPTGSGNRTVVSSVQRRVMSKTDVIRYEGVGNGNFSYSRANSGIWEHVVVTSVGRTGQSQTNPATKIYVNGSLVMTSSVARGNAGGSAHIGSMYGTTDFFSGYIDDLRIYNRVLSAAEVAAIYDATK